MAYLDLRASDGLTAESQPYRDAGAAGPGPAAPDRLTALEWSVVAIARNDGRASLARPGRIATAVRVLFNQPNARLADERLEALRRIAVLTRLDGAAVPPHEVRAFLAAGFTPGQHAVLVDSIAVGRASGPERGRTGPR